MFVLWVSPVFSQTIKSIETLNVPDLNRDRIISLLGLNEGDVFSENEADKGIKRLSDTGRFQSVEIEYDNLNSSLKLKLIPLDLLESVEIIFSSSHSIDLENLLRKDIVEVIGFSRGDQISLGQLGEVRDRVLRKLKQRGFFSATAILALEESGVEYRKNLILSIDTGSQEAISGISFKGFSFLEMREIKSLMEETKYSRDFLDKMQIPYAFSSSLKSGKMLSESEQRDDREEKYFEFDFPLDQILLTQTLNEWSQERRKEGYFDVRVEGRLLQRNQKSFYSFELFLGPKYNIQFRGNVNFWERNLRAMVLDKTSRLGLPFNESEALNLVKDKYLSEGFKDVIISLQRDNLKDERRITFNVKEGRRFFLGDVLWDGLSPDEIVEMEEIVSRWRRQISNPLHHIYYDEKFIKTQMSPFLDLIKSEGYLQARFLGLRFKKPNSGNRIPIEIPIQIGPRFKVRGVEVAGYHPLEDESLDSLVDIEIGDWANFNKILQTTASLREAVRDKSFLFATVTDSLENIVEYSDSTDEVDIHFRVDAGPKIKLGQIVVDGLRKTREEVVLREFRRENMESGDFWKPQSLELIDQRLQSYGLLGNLRTQMSEGRVLERSGLNTNGVEIQERDLRISFVERPGGAIEFGPGYRTDLGLIGFGEFNYRNLTGKNRSVVLRGQISRKLTNFQFFEQRYLLSYLEPYLFNFPLSMRFSLSYEKRDQYIYDKFNNPTEQSFNTEEVSASFVIGREFNKHISLRHNLYSLSKPRNFDLKGEERGGTQIYRIATMGPALIFDYRDNMFNPSNGYLLSSSLEYAAPDLGSSYFVNYLLSKNDFSYYKLLNPDFVFALFLSYSHMENVGTGANLPLDRRLTLGGRTTLRSLPEKKINFFDRDQVDVMNSYLMKIEFRQTLFMGLGFAYFFDMGRVDALGYSSEGWRESLGIGLRYLTPVGPLSLDFAFNADVKANEDLSRILFSVGVF